MLRVVKVTQYDRRTGMVKVLVPEERQESGWLNVMAFVGSLPPVGQVGRAIFDDGAGYASGIYLGRHLTGEVT